VRNVAGSQESKYEVEDFGKAILWEGLMNI
jgi:hypothetical protein